jgi:hypothetical protein
MALPNNLIDVLDALGVSKSTATHLVGTKHYQTIMLADADGHIQGSAPVYLMFMQPRVLTTSATDEWDLFNASGSGKVIRVRKLFPALTQTAATAFTASFVFEVRRTSTVGSGGNTATFETTSTPASGAVNLSRISTLDPTLPAQVTARGVPTGGATSSHYLHNITLHAEETQPSSHQLQLVNWLVEMPGDPSYELQEGQGIKLRKTSTIASTGLSVGWLIAFGLVP